MVVKWHCMPSSKFGYSVCMGIIQRYINLCLFGGQNEIIATPFGKLVGHIKPIERLGDIANKC